MEFLRFTVPCFVDLTLTEGAATEDSSAWAPDLTLRDFSCQLDAESPDPRELLLPNIEDIRFKEPVVERASRVIAAAARLLFRACGSGADFRAPTPGDPNGIRSAQTRNFGEPGALSRGAARALVEQIRGRCRPASVRERSAQQPATDPATREREGKEGEEGSGYITERMSENRVSETASPLTEGGQQFSCVSINLWQHEFVDCLRRRDVAPIVHSYRCMHRM